VNLAIALLTLALLAAVIIVISSPLRSARSAGSESDSERGELEAARDGKYRELRDAELDYRTGKLSKEDYEATDRALRAEALQILNRLEASRRAATAKEGPDVAGEARARAGEAGGGAAGEAGVRASDGAGGADSGGAAGGSGVRASEEGGAGAGPD